MVRLLILVICGQLCFFSTAHGLNDNVKVRIKKNIPSLKISGYFKTVGQYKIKSKNKIELLVSRRTVQNKQYWQVKNTKNKKSIYFKSKRLTFLGSHLVSVNNLLPKKINIENIPEHFVLWKEPASPKFHLVAEMPMDQYLKGVLAGEMPLSWPKEALKAQAIASKSYALSVAKERAGQYYHLDGDVYDQVYKHTHNNKYSAKLSDVVNETSSEYLMASDGQVLKAYYHANSGGVTELPINVWQDADWNPMYKVVKSPDSNKWKYHLTKAEFIQKISQEYRGFSLNSLLSLKVYEKSESGRVTSLSFLLDGEPQTITGQKLRELVGFGKIKSTFFNFNIGETQVAFNGKGYGHGVGMSQKGASLLAKKGLSYKSILKHFYPKVFVSREPSAAAE